MGSAKQRSTVSRSSSSGGSDVESLLLSSDDDDGASTTLGQMLSVISAVCDSSLVPGEAVDASAPYDVAWWSVFPTVERLWVRRKLSRGFSDEAWANADGETQVCQSSGSCDGHNAEDIIPLPVFARGTDGYFRSRHYSNQELYTVADPARISGNYSLPYVYEHFEWPHCTTQGFAF